MDAYEATKVIDSFAEYQHCFAQQEILGYVVTHKERELLLQAITEDWRFVRTDEEVGGEVYFIPKKTLYRWYVNLNIRLAKMNTARMNDRELAHLMSFLNPDSRWNISPLQFVKFGEFFSLVRPTVNPHVYIFPLAYLLSFMAPSKVKIAKETLDNFNTEPWLTLPSDQMILERIQNVLGRLTPRERNILSKREGLLGNAKMTLEQIGQELNLTRERIRQIEDKSWGKLRHPSYNRYFVTPLLFYVICHDGSMLVPQGSMRNLIMFIAKCNNVPVAMFPHTSLSILGLTKEDIVLPSDIWKSAPDLTKVASQLETYGMLLVNKQDQIALAQRLSVYLLRRLYKAQKVYLALKSIGRPAHFTEVTKIYHSLFPEDQDTEHSIHARLIYNSYGIVWIGSKGTYALEEWGYKRPSLTLINTVIEIVERKYAETGTPVPYSVVLAEIGKYRKIVNPSSVSFVTYSNPRLIQTERDCFIPRPIEESEIEDSAEELDKILQEFERQFGGHHSEEETK